MIANFSGAMSLVARAGTADHNLNSLSLELRPNTNKGFVVRSSRDYSRRLTLRNFYG